MAESPLSKKLGIKTGEKVLVLNAPDGYLDKLADRPDNVEIATQSGGKFDQVQLFVANQAELAKFTPQALAALEPSGCLWIAYPKISSKVKTDLTRDKGWDSIRNTGYEGVSLIAVDDTWSAMRYRPTSEVKSTRKAKQP